MDIILRQSLPKLREKLLEALQAVLPIVGIVLALCFSIGTFQIQFEAISCFTFKVLDCFVCFQSQ